MTGVCGVGHLGFHHARILKGLTKGNVRIFDRDTERLDFVSEELSIEKASSLDELLEISDTLVVASITTSHHEVVMKALNAGLHVLVEKPIASTVEEAIEMVELAESKGLVLAVGHTERFNPAVIAAASLIANPLFIEGHRMAPFRPRGTDVSVVMDLMIHDIDLVLSFVHSPVVSVHASGVPVLSNNVDIASARISFENGCVANMTASRISRNQLRKLRIFQKNNYISLNFAEKKVSALRFFDGDIVPVPVEIDDCDALTAELNDFLNAVKFDIEPAVTGRAGLGALRSAQIISTEIEKAIKVSGN